jgi:AcrR family transcriptional regulator
MRKHIERQQRQEAILRTAEELLSKHGYLGLKMDDIAAAIGYAKGTIYQHFSSKEDMLLALVARRDQRYASWFMRAAQFQGRARECFVGCGLADRLFRVLHPDHLEHQHLLRQKSFWEKTSTQWQDAVVQAGKNCETAVHGIIGVAQASGDLTADMAAMQDLILGVRSLSLGTHLLNDEPNRESCSHLAAPPLQRLTRLQHRLIDSYGWRPLFDEWDYQATEQRLLEEAFPDEARLAGWLPTA